MRKANKILMATVAILLCLVLISTSVVSGVFAKFAIKKTAMVENAKLKQFGLTVGLYGTSSGDAGLKTFADNGGGSYNSNTNMNDGKNIVAVAKDFKIGDGDECKNAVKFVISGTPITAAKLNIKIDLVYNLNNFKITHSDFDYINEGDDKYFMPLAFSFGGTSSCGYVTQPWLSSDDDDIVDITSEDAFEHYIATKMAEKIVIGDTNTKNKKVTGNVISLEFTEDKAPNFTVDSTKNTFFMGFGWPDSSEYPDYAEISTFLAEYMTSMQIIYTVWVEQTAARAN